MTFRVDPLSDARLIVSNNGRRQETAVADNITFTDLLARHFAIHLSP